MYYKVKNKEGTNEMTKATCGHPISEDNITCIFWTRCEGNSETDIFRGMYAIALERVDGDEAHARRITESGMSGLLQGGHI